MENEDFSFLNEIAEKNEIDLREFMEHVKKEINVKEDETTQKLLKIEPVIESYCKELDATEKTLIELSNLLSNYQNELKEVSMQVKILQDKSEIYGVKLSNRKSLENHIITFLNEVALGSNTLKILCEGDMDDAFEDALVKLIKTITKLDEYKEEYPVIVERKKAIKEVVDRTAIKIRAYMMCQIESLKKPMTNVQIIQGSKLQKHSNYMGFLLKYCQPVYIEISNLYSDTINKVYSTQLKSYIASVQNLAESKSIGSLLDDDSGNYQIDNRLEILKTLLNEPIIPHLANKKKYFHEEIFRSETKVLCTMAINEYDFVLKYLCLEKSQSSYIFNIIFKRVTEDYANTLGTRLNSMIDTHALMIMNAINTQHKEFMKGIPILDTLFDLLSRLIWKRLITIIDSHLMDLKRFTPKLSILLDSHTIPVVKKFSFLISGLRHPEMPKSQMLDVRLPQLINEIVLVIDKFSQKAKTEDIKYLFIVNCIAHISSESPDKQLEAALDKAIEKLMLYFINHYFQSLVGVVTSCSSKTIKGDITFMEEEIQKLNKSHLENIAQYISLNWKSKLEELQAFLKVNSEGKAICKVLSKILNELMSMYSTFGEIVRKSNDACYKEMLGQKVLFEMKTLLISLK